MRSKDLMTLALVGVIGWIAYEHFGIGKTWGQSLATLPGGSSLASSMGLTGMDGLGCGARCYGAGVGGIAPTSFFGGYVPGGAGIPSKAERLFAARF